MEIYLKHGIRIPTIPNFILTEGEDMKQSIPLKLLSRKEAEMIADEWKKQFMRKAGY